MSEQPIRVTVQPLTPESFEPFGYVLGKPLSSASVAFVNPATDFRSEHIFNSGPQGQTEVLWVSYRNSDANLKELEVHHLTEQAIVPLDGDVIHVVASSDSNGAPAIDTLAAFDVLNGTGICMRPGTWHATRVRNKSVTCLMLTRPSTTLDLIAHLNGRHQASESAMHPIPAAVLADPL